MQRTLKSWLLLKNEVLAHLPTILAYRIQVVGKSASSGIEKFTKMKINTNKTLRRSFLLSVLDWFIIFID